MLYDTVFYDFFKGGSVYLINSSVLYTDQYNKLTSSIYSRLARHGTNFFSAILFILFIIYFISFGFYTAHPPPKGSLSGLHSKS